MIDIRVVKEQDVERVVRFCTENGKRVPKEIGTSMIAERRETGEILGFFHVAPKLFLDPLVVSKDVGKIEALRLYERLLDVVSGIVSNTGNKIYFTAEGDEFISFLQKKYQIEEYTKETTYLGEL